MQYENAYNFLLPKLQHELPSWVTYHTAAHTRSVLNSAITLAKAELVEGEDLILIKTAALFHDAGFLHQSDGHEELSCRIAEEHLPRFGYQPRTDRQGLPDHYGHPYTPDTGGSSWSDHGGCGSVLFWYG